jgi:NarL family two-component system sensor histidine kinase LiaS
MTHIKFDQLTDPARLARELHDGIAQDLVGVGYSLDLLLANPETSIESRAQLRALRFTVTDLIDKVRREIYFLRQPARTTN